MVPKGYALVEGQGEVTAVQNLLVRLCDDLGFSFPWSKPMRWKNLHQMDLRRGKGGVRTGIEFVRPMADAGALLILRDEDDRCPKDVAPGVAGKLRNLALPFPVAYVLLHPEYEVLFLPCLEDIAGDLPDGRTGIRKGTRWDGGSWESRRGIKGWLSRQYPRGRSYKPSVDQLPMTRKISFEKIREADVPCFGSLERAMKTLCQSWGRPGVVYPRE